MEGSVGDVVVVPFPFSNLSGAKRRPALVLARTGADYILCQITASRSDEHSIELLPRSCVDGALRVTSHIRPNKLFTAEHTLLLGKACRVSDAILERALHSLVSILRKH